MHHDEAAFLTAVFNRPDDDLPRLVYADWLEERDDPRAEFLRLDVEQHSPVNSGKDRQAALTKRMTELTPALDNRWVWWIGRTRDMARGVRLDWIDVRDGEGRIDVRGGEQETVLVVDGRPVAFNWDDCMGSVGQYLVFTGHSGGPALARLLADLCEYGIITGRPLAEQFGPILGQFTSGSYLLVYTPSDALGSASVFDHPGPLNAARAFENYYPADDRHLVCTQPRESLYGERVAYYRNRIQGGLRPVVLTVAADGAWCEFVVDGHHKLSAYGLEGVRPAVVGIVRWDAPAISYEEGRRLLPPGHPGVEEYRRMKGYGAR